jgi:hypothetical protein
MRQVAITLRRLVVLLLLLVGILLGWIAAVRIARSTGRSE